ncbi:unnamed protein product [Brassica oleracea var. botrytis]
MSGPLTSQASVPPTLKSRSILQFRFPRLLKLAEWMAHLSMWKLNTPGPLPFALIAKRWVISPETVIFSLYRQSQTLPNIPKQFCYSCKAPGHLMKNCPKGPKYWVQISRKKKHTCSTVDEPQVGSQQTQSDSLPKEPSDHQPLPDTSISIDPDTATDVLTNDLGTVLPPPVPASMDIDSPPPPLPSVSLDTNLVSSTSSITIPQTEPISPPYLTNCVLGLAAVCPPRPVIPNNHLTTPKISFTSLNPFQLLSPPGNSLQLSPPNSPRTSPITSPKSPAKVPTFEIISASPSLDPSPLLVTPSSPAVLNSDQSANDLHLPHPEAGTPSI